MYVNTETLTGQTRVFDEIIEEIPGGVGFERARLKTGATIIKAGTLVYVTGRSAKIVKTGTVVAGGAANAPQVNLNHQFKAGEYISDGQAVAVISSITEGTTYDTLNLGANLNLATVAGTILFEVKAAAVIGNFCSATVVDTAAHSLAVNDPSGQSVGLKVTISQAADDNLAVAYTIATGLTIALANTTAGKNTAALIQAAIRALVSPDYPFAGYVCVGTDWSAETGATLTTPTANMAANAPDLYLPTGMLKNDVNVENANPSVSVVTRGTVREADLTYPVPTRYKNVINLIKFS